VAVRHRLGRQKRKKVSGRNENFRTLWDLRNLQRKLWRQLSCGMWRRVVQKLPTFRRTVVNFNHTIRSHIEEGFTIHFKTFSWVYAIRQTRYTFWVINAILKEYKFAIHSISAMDQFTKLILIRDVKILDCLVCNTFWVSTALFYLICSINRDHFTGL
jgi:hypothetical protein